TLDKSKFTDGVCTIEYETDVPDSCKNSPVNKSVSNKAQLTYEDSCTQSSEKWVTIPGTIGKFVSKSCSSENGNISWTVSIDIPNVDNISSIDISDYMNVYSSFFTDSTVFTVIDSNNISHALSEVGSRGWYSDQQFQLSITNTAFINNNRNETIKLVYTTPSNDISKVTNTTTVNIKFSDNTSASDSGSAVYAIPGTKEAYSLNNISFIGKDALTGAMAWHIAVTKGESYQAGDVIKLTDTLQNGLEFVPGSLAVNAANPYWFDPNNAYADCVSVSEANGVITIIINVTAEMADVLNRSDSKAIDIAFITQMTDSEYISWLTGNIARTYTNEAKITINDGTEYTTAPAFQVLTPDSTDVVNKFVSGTQKPSAGSEDPNYYAVYTVEINKECLRLNGGDPFDASDTLGSNLEYVTDSISISPDDGTFSYDSANKQISITGLHDETAYTIRYKVKVKQIYLSDSYTESEIGSMFGNTVSVTLGGSNSIGSSTCLDEGTYRSKGDYTFDQTGYSLTIKGKKFWSDDTASIRPSMIKIKLKVIKYVTPNTGGEAHETESEPFYKEYTIYPDVQSDDTWSYSISDLPLYSNDNVTGKVRYSYSVSEISIDGYSATYQIDSDSSSNISVTNEENLPHKISIGSSVSDAVCVIDITNRFTAQTNETGKLTVFKEWKNEADNSTRPANITFTLTDETGASYNSRTIGSLDASAEFTDLPLFTYSRSTDSSGNEILVRTPRKYTITEETVADYTTTYSERTFTLTDSTSYSAGINKSVTVVNSYNSGSGTGTVTPQDIKIIKTVNGKNSSNAANAVFTLYDSDANGNIDRDHPIADAHPAPSSSGKYYVIFSGDTLSTDHTYYIAETTPADGCDLNNTEYRCRITANGMVMYSVGNSAESTVFPTCDNIAQPNDISLIKTFKAADGSILVPGSDELTEAVISATKFTLTDTASGPAFVPVTKSPTLNGSDYTVTFTKNDGLRSGRTYKLFESSSPDTFTSSNSIYYCRIDDAGNVSYSTELNGTYSDSFIPGFTNTKLSNTGGTDVIGSIKLIKTYRTENGTDAAPTANELTETEFTLSDTESSSAFTPVTRFPQLIGNEYTVTFTANDGLQKGRTYMLRETGSPDTFTSSDSVYYCRIDDEGKVSYSTELNGTYSDSFTPSFTNTKIDNPGGTVTPGTIRLIKTYRTNDGTALVPTEDMLRSTVFTLTCADDSNFIRTASPSWDGAQATVTFSEGLTSGYTYLLSETSAPEGCTVSSTTYYCSIDGLTGNVSYSTDGVNYSPDFPVCVNTITNAGPDVPADTGSIQLIKTVQGENSNPADAVNAVFTLTCLNDSTFIRSASPVWDGSKATVTFSEGLTPGYTYLLSETSAPEGYTASSVTYYCSIDELTGNVSYSTDGVSYSSDFPVCVNVRNSSDTPIIPDNPYPDNPYPDNPYPDYPIYPNEPIYPPYCPVEEVPPFIIYPDEPEDVSSGAGISESAEEDSSDIGMIAAFVFISSLIATAAAGLIGKRKHNR
ncbi:MAG: SpaA isopeptide-forming pilin-related protein, partial [Oscillospiraceae bacterium]